MGKLKALLVWFKGKDKKEAKALAKDKGEGITDAIKIIKLHQHKGKTGKVQVPNKIARRLRKLRDGK